MLLRDRAKIESSGAPGDSWAPSRAAGDKLSSNAPPRKVSSAKRKKKEVSAARPRDQQEIARAEGVKQRNREEVSEEEEERCMSKALCRILPRLIDRITPPPHETTDWCKRAREAEVGCARLAVSMRVYQSHKNFSVELEELVRGKAERSGVREKARRGGVRGETKGGRVETRTEARAEARAEARRGRIIGLREKYLENVLRKLEVRMLEDADAEI